MPSALHERVASFFSNGPGTVLAVYVFGSAARGDARPGSDVDVAVLFDDVPPRTLDGGTLALSGHLEHHVGAPSISSS